VAQTIAERAAELCYLGASFCFSRHEDQRKTGSCFSALSPFNYPSTTSNSVRIGTALESIPDAASRRLRDQLKDLIINPLRDVCISNGRPVLIAIDALDECEVEDAREIIDLLARNIRQFSLFQGLHIRSTEAAYQEYSLWQKLRTISPA
jgi:hypothetical protein